MSDVEDRLREALRDLAPTRPTTDGLAEGAWRSHARERRRRLAAAGATVLAVLAGTGAAVGLLDRPPPAIPSGPVLTPGDCTDLPQPLARAALTEWDLETAPRLRAAWICPDPADPQTQDGWELPLTPLTGRYAQGVAPPLAWLDRPSGSAGIAADAATCGPLRSGPAFTFTRQTENGLATTSRSVDDMCGGAQTIRLFLEAMADQEADALAASAPDPGLACRSDQAWIDGTEGVRGMNSPLVTATMCFAPKYWDATGGRMAYLQPMVPRTYRSVDLPPDTLADLNRDMTTAAYYRGNGECAGEGAWTYSVLGRTASGTYRKLRTACLDEMFEVGQDHWGFDVSPDTTAKLRALVPPG